MKKTLIKQKKQWSLNKDKVKINPKTKRIKKKNKVVKSTLNLKCNNKNKNLTMTKKNLWKMIKQRKRNLDAAK